MEDIFSWIFVQNSVLVQGYQKLFGLVMYAFMVYNFDKLHKRDKWILSIFTVLIIKLILESFIEYDSFFRQLTMFTVLFPIIFIVFTKYLFGAIGKDLLGFVAKFYLATYIVFMILFGREFSFSLDSIEMTDYGPFSADTRIIHASHIFMIIIPLIWYLDQYISSRKYKFMLPFLFCAGVIVLHQHRSVWSSAIVAILFYAIATIRNRRDTIPQLWGISVKIVSLALVVYFFISNLFPGFMDFLGERFSEIFDPARDGSTGNFRIEQREVYGALFLERPLFGWTFEGFEMENPLVDWWPENTGQHFHEGYMEMLFYHGIVGLLFKFSFLFYLLLKAFSKNLSQHSIILIAFSVSGLIFSFNYVLPLIFWGHVGMCFYYLEKNQTDKIAEQNDKPPIILSL